LIAGVNNKFGIILSSHTLKMRASTFNWVVVFCAISISIKLYVLEEQDKDVAINKKIKKSFQRFVCLEQSGW